VAVSDEDNAYDKKQKNRRQDAKINGDAPTKDRNGQSTNDHDKTAPPQDGGDDFGEPFCARIKEAGNDEDEKSRSSSEQWPVLFHLRIELRMRSETASPGMPLTSPLSISRMRRCVSRFHASTIWSSVIGMMRGYLVLWPHSIHESHHVAMSFLSTSRKLDRRHAKPFSSVA
jgi:hypothetical protein